MPIYSFHRREQEQALRDLAAPRHNGANNAAAIHADRAQHHRRLALAWGYAYAVAVLAMAVFLANC